MFESLYKIDPGLLLIPSNYGGIAVSNKLQGRIFCELDSKLIHRFDEKLAADPSPDKFNNIGGNSLWPGPEGGAFAFNYLRDGDWLVQDGINKQPTETVYSKKHKCEIGKKITLLNRKTKKVELDFSRTILHFDVSGIAEKYGLKGIAYRTVDELNAEKGYSLNYVLFCAWSLEQFSGGNDVIAFGKTSSAATNAVNTDYYGSPAERLTCHGNFFRLELGGIERFQVGVKHAAKPEFIGAYAPARELLIIRRSWTQDGCYFNIADNKQPAGPDSAADSFSIFNGGELNFFELETIAPLQIDSYRRVISSVLWSETMIFNGKPEKIFSCLKNNFHVPVSLVSE